MQVRQRLPDTHRKGLPLDSHGMRPARGKVKAQPRRGQRHRRFRVGTMLVPRLRPLQA